MTFEEWWRTSYFNDPPPNCFERLVWQEAQKQEREACALIADVVAGGHVYDNGTDEAYYAAAYIAEQIRARCDVNITKSEG